MQNSSRSYKYSCRKCPIRQRCIDAKSYGPGLKTEIAHRFVNRTDTFETWDLLQQDCLLIRYEVENKQRAQHESSLLRRLREAREPTQEPGLSPSQPVQSTPDAPTKAGQRPSTPFSEQPLSGGRTSYGFTVVASERLVRMPADGDIVFGRFEHGLSAPPDIDLTLEDGEISSVSRRHALVIGREGQHWIEDMGSGNGTYVNGHQLPLGKTVQLSPGDRILLGRCRLVYSALPGWMSEPDPRQPHETSLVITHTGDRLPLPDKSQVTLGRPDAGLGYVPDVDISTAGNIALYVSRRHVRLIARGGLHFLEELGSAAGTRLNGRAILVGEAPSLLHPGDHFWLGGCVVAYEWELL